MTRELQLYSQWVEKTREHPEHARELSAIQGNEEEIRDRFYRDLEFGTAGLRGVLGLGTNRMNVYTVGRATQGLAEYLNGKSAAPSVAIAYDSRILSDVFAREAARVLAANGIRARLFGELAPTPALSYAVRELGCDAGINITASHNPASYNGYKVYGSDGCQIGTEEADGILEIIGRTDPFDGVGRMDFDEAKSSLLIEEIPDSLLQKYLDRVFREAVQPEVCGKAGLRLVYTPLNGAGNRCVRRILQMAGVRDVTVVPQQEQPDGNFPTCPYPNPETAEALELGLALCRETGADMLLATDPDADRVAVAVRTKDGSYQRLTGNEAGVLLLDYIARTRRRHGTMPQNPVAVKSIVSTNLADAVAREHGVEMVNVLTGFKYIGEVILGLERKGEDSRYIFGFEESCGYLSGSYVRDKDAVNASLLLAEMASAYKLEGKTLADALEDIYSRHGIYRSLVESFAFEGADGMKKMSGIMDSLRRSAPGEIGGQAVTAAADYLASTRTRGGVSETIPLPKSNVLEYVLRDGCTVIVRPSGTEPKIKIYYSLVGRSREEIGRLEKLYTAACKELLDRSAAG